MVQTNAEVQLTCDPKTSSPSTAVYWLRQRQAPGTDSHHEFLAVMDSAKKPVHGQGVEEKKLTVRQEGTQSVLRLRDVKPEDSGVYFCLTIGTPKLTFGKGTRLSVGKTLAQCYQ